MPRPPNVPRDVLRLSVGAIATPVGGLRVVSDAHGALRAVDWDDHEPRLLRLLARHYGANGFTLARGAAEGPGADALRAYVAGDVRAIDGVAAETRGTAFQRLVWGALRAVPCGATVSYAEIARRVGRPSAVRAVGLANGANPVGVVVPCHRVVGADGSLTGYGGGIERKRWLLAHEAAHGGLGAVAGA